MKWDKYMLIFDCILHIKTLQEIKECLTIVIYEAIDGNIATLSKWDNLFYYLDGKREE